MENNYLTNRELLKKEKIATDYGVKCAHCGHRMLITNRFDRVICTWCGNWIYRNKKAEFRYRIEKEMKKNAKN